MKRILLIVSLLSLTTLAFSADQVTSLPKVFSGWRLQKAQTSSDASKADPTYSDLLKEYGFNELETAIYVKPDRTMTVKAARFNDASGAYGAFTFYRAPEMNKESVADQAASNQERVLFLRGNFLIDAKFDHITPMSAAELRELAAALPAAGGNAANLPTLTEYLPKQGMVEGTTKYVSGPTGLARLGSALPAQQVDFGTGAEIAAAQYRTSQGTAELLLIGYPTPAVAGERLKTIDQWRTTSASGSAPAVYFKRSGRIVAVVSGPISEGEAKSLLGSVSYEADVTWNQNTHYDPKNNIGNLLLNVVVLICIIFGLALVAGFAFGGLRYLARRLSPGSMRDNDEIEIIRLDIGK